MPDRTGLQKAGIVADNYKVDWFKKTLTEAGFTNFEVEPFSKELTSIIVYTIPDKFPEIQKVCGLVEIHFKQSN